MTELIKAYGIELKENIMLSEYSTLKIGGACRLAVFPKTADELKTAVDILQKSGVKHDIIGHGSNILFSDRGYDGTLVFTCKLNELKLISDTKIYAGAGAGLSSVSSLALKNSLSGAEFMHGIPGSCGGAVYMNAGAYGGEISSILKYSEHYDISTGKFVMLSNAENKFSYRSSIYQTNKELLITGACFELRRGNADEIKALMAENMQKRREKQPLEYPSAGSAFKRPQNGYAAQMIDECGLKGMSVGGAQVSEKHAGFIINIGGATSDDVLKLMNTVKEKVYEKFGVELEPEIQYIKD